MLAHTLRQIQAPVQSEVSAARSAWPAVAGGLSARLTPRTHARIALADRRAAAIAPPRFLDAEGALTGPAAQLSGLVKAYTRLTQRGWRTLAVATGAQRARAVSARAARVTSDRGRGARDATARSAASAVAFLRANSGLYIYCVYDGHFDLSLVGKKLQDAYRKLGGPRGFGGTLSAAEVQALARAYSVDAVRLAPHPAGRVGV